MLHKYEVGTLYHPERTHWPETVQYNWRQGGHELVFFVANLTSKEVKAIQQGTMEFALFTEGSLIFLLYRVAGFGDWSDAPYSWHLVKEMLPEQATLPPAVLDEERYLLSVTLVEATTGIIKALRVVTFSPQFTRQLHAAIERQALSPWHGNAAYNAAIGDVYRRFPAAADMAQAATVRCAT